MPTLIEANGKWNVFLKNVVTTVIKAHFNNRTYPWWTFLAVDIANLTVILLGLVNHARVWKYIMALVPKGMELYFYVALPLMFWASVELAQSRWGRDFFWYTHWHTAGIGEGTWYTIPGVVITTLFRMLKSVLILGGTWVVFQSVDPRLGTITSETFIFYWPLLVITVCMYVLEGMVFYMSLLLSDIVGWIKMISISAGMLYAYQAYKIMSRVSLTTWKDEWNHADGGDVFVSTIDWAHLYHLSIFYGPRLIIIAIAVLIVVYFAVRTHERWNDIFAIICVTPTITVLLIAGTISYRWYSEIYLPDRIAQLAAAALIQVTEAPATEAPIASEEPVVTEIPATFTALPVFTETVTPMPTFTTTPTATSTPESVTYMIPPCGDQYVVYSMTSSVDTRGKCIGDNTGLFQQGYTNYSVMLYIDEKTNVANYILGEGVPDTVICTINGGKEMTGKSHWTNLGAGNYKATLHCTWDNTIVDATANP